MKTRRVNAMDVRRMIVCLCMIVLSWAMTTLGADKKPMTNADIIMMIKAGLPESTIILAIKQGATEFDTSPMALVDLKNQGVSTGMLEAMMKPAVTTTTGNNAADTAVPNDAKVWMVHDGKNVVLRHVMGYKEDSIGQALKLEFGVSIKNKFAILVREKKAATRFSSSPTCIYTRLDLSQSGLVKLTVQEKRDRRFVWIVHRVGSTMGESYPPSVEVKGEAKDIGNGIQTFTFTTPLPPGEYGFVASENEGRSYIVYDFAIDAKQPEDNTAVTNAPRKMDK